MYIEYSMCHLKQAQDGATHPPQWILSPSAKPQSNYAPRVKYRGARSHPRPQPSRILNPYNDESSTVPHPLRVYYDAKRAAPAALLALLMVLSPSVKPDPENAQTMHHEIQECAATQDPNSRVTTTHTTTKQVRCHTPTLVGFLTPRNPHPKNPWTRLGRNTGVRAGTQDLNPHISPTPTTTNQVRRHTPTSVLSPSAKPNPENAQTTHHETQECAATQDPDSRVPTTHMTTKQVFSLRKTPIQRIHGQGPGKIQACAQPLKTLTLDYSQPIQRGDLKYGATHPPKIKTFMVPWNLWIMVEDEDVDGFPWGPPRFFNPILYPAAFTPVYSEEDPDGPSTLAANRSKLSRLSGPDTVPCQHSQDGAPDSEPASNLGLWSGQSCTSNQEYSGLSPMTWSKDGDAEAAPVDATWSDLFNNQEKLEMYSRSRQLLLKPSACCYLQKEWSLVFTSSQRHFQYFGISSTLHPLFIKQAGRT
ncbi:hypothetical protein BS47DRAFT_1369258 [Hydnum rufescens UP504]|uniref:Uncharacterized protein n=1 Tax=Hydnum rufescens UP504 TaxID=1448309 RepID=A0A9P6ADC3_9AGAM|nr:hypothetical protein BS47DRAFT_1369258 [Hydnum rufescens UP504]